ncbi:MAG: dihydroneopterin aldolase [Synechococcus sp.]|nr:dihydroneopterin aldolase [Synechococcus sp.]
MASGDCIVVRDLRLWAHVGVLEHERELGQWFSLDLSFGVDLTAAAASDCLADTLDYAEAVQAVRQLVAQLRCQTIEHFSERILDRLQELYGPLPIHLELRKLAAPIPGFDGVVAVQRQR